MTIDVSTEVNDLFRQKMMEFIGWCQENWQITEKDTSHPDEWLSDKSPGYVEGYNGAIEGLSGAFECWNEEFP